MINLVIFRITCISVDSRLWCLHITSMMSNRSFIGMLVCMLDMLNDAIFRPGAHGISAKSFITCTELRTCMRMGAGCMSLAYS